MFSSTDWMSLSTHCILLHATRAEALNFLNHGLRMTYDDFGEGFPLLFVHGHCFDRTMWSSQLQSLRWKYRVVAPDLRGYGESESDGGQVCTQETFASDLERLLDHCRIERACVVGLSMGGQIAMQLATALPSRTAGLVLAATFAEAETPEGVTERNRVADRIVAEGIVGFGSEMLPKLMSPASLKRQPLFASRVFQMICQSAPIAAAAANRGRAMRSDYRSALAKYSGASMIIVGTQDAYTSVAKAQALQALMKDCRLEIFEGIGHLPNLEDEDRFNRCLHFFLNQIVARG